MKKILIIVLLFYSFALRSQGYYVGIRLGTSLNHRYAFGSESGSGGKHFKSPFVGISTVFQPPKSKFFFLKADLNYSKKAGRQQELDKFYFDRKSGITTYSLSKFSSMNLAFGIGLSTIRTWGVKVFFCPSIGYLYNGDLTVIKTVGNEVLEETIINLSPKEYKSIDLGYNLGFNLYRNIDKGTFFLEIALQKGTIDFNTFYNRGISYTLGYYHKFSQ